MKNIGTYIGVLFAAFVTTNTMGGKPDSRDIDVLRGIADKILANTEFPFTDKKTGRRYASVSPVFRCEGNQRVQRLEIKRVL